MQKRMIALFLVFVMLFTGLIGCSKDKEQKNEKKSEQSSSVSSENTDKDGIQPSKAVTAMGRFMEKKVDFPELAKGENIIKIIKNAQKQIELHTKIKGKYLCYQLNADMTWKSSTPGWLNDGKLSGNDIEIYDLCCGSDGNYYIAYADFSKDSQSRIFMSADGGKTSKQVRIPYLEEGKDSKNGKVYPMIHDIDVLKNGNIVIYDLGADSSLKVFSPKGEKLDTLSIADQDYGAFYMASGNNIITAKEDNKAIIVYNTESKKVDKTVDYKVNSRAMAYAETEDGTVFMADTNGIHRLNKNGTLWETTVDGALNSMSMPSMDISELCVVPGDTEQYYIAYQSEDDGSYQLLHYVYDKNVSSVPNHVITVYSLRENNTIRQAISLFQAKDADVKINYVVAMGEEGGSLSDYIRSLNTELLAGNGADILVLDGLPVNSYLEKGVLADISDIVKPLETSGKLLTNITGSYSLEGKVYQIPIRFHAPIIFGEKDAVAAVKDMDSIISYIQTSNKPYTCPITYRSLLENYLTLYSADLFDNGTLAENKLTAFLEKLKKIADNIKATEFYEDKNMDSDTNSDYIDPDTFFMRNSLDIYNKKYSAEINQISGVYSMILEFTIIKKCNFELSSVNQTFMPKGMVGLNKASKNADTAKKFIEFLLSEEVQNANVYDGFPVNVNSLNKWMSEENQGTFGTSTKDGTMISGSWPTKEQREELLKLIKELKTPVKIDQTIFKIIIEESLPYFTGDISAEQAAAAANTKINTYLAE